MSTQSKLSPFSRALEAAMRDRANGSTPLMQEVSPGPWALVSKAWGSLRASFGLTPRAPEVPRVVGWTSPSATSPTYETASNPRSEPAMPPTTRVPDFDLSILAKRAATKPLLANRIWAGICARVAVSRQAQRGRRLRVLETISLGDKRTAMILQVQQQEFLVGGGPSGISLLACLSGEQNRTGTSDRLNAAGAADIEAALRKFEAEYMSKLKAEHTSKREAEQTAKLEAEQTSACARTKEIPREPQIFNPFPSNATSVPVADTTRAPTPSSPPIMAAPISEGMSPPAPMTAEPAVPAIISSLVPDAAAVIESVGSAGRAAASSEVHAGPVYEATGVHAHRGAATAVVKQAAKPGKLGDRESADKNSKEKNSNVRSGPPTESSLSVSQGQDKPADTTAEPVQKARKKRVAAKPVAAAEPIWIPRPSAAAEPVITKQVAVTKPVAAAAEGLAAYRLRSAKPAASSAVSASPLEPTASLAGPPASDVEPAAAPRANSVTDSAVPKLTPDSARVVTTRHGASLTTQPAARPVTNPIPVPMTAAAEVAPASAAVAALMPSSNSTAEPARMAVPPTRKPVRVRRATTTTKSAEEATVSRVNGMSNSLPPASPTRTRSPGAQ